MNQKVFIVEEGEFCEGGVICGVFTTHDKALRYIETHYDCTKWKPTRTDRWEFGCDYIEIGKYEVE